MTASWHFALGVYSANPCRPEDACLILSDGNPVLSDNHAIWTGGFTQALDSAPLDAVYLGEWDGRPLYAVEAGSEPSFKPGIQPTPIRTAVSFLPEDEASTVNMGRELLYWQANHKFCPACGSRLTDHPGERAHRCPQCGKLYYPPISPAVIVAIRKADKILLAHNVRFTDGTYGLIAGFVESGETLEQAVRREIREEVGLQVRNIRYIASQSWPYPHNLMLGFTAEYDSGEIKPDGQEIDKADWFSQDSLPTTPRPGSIAWRLINLWQNGEL